MVNNSSPISDL